MPRKANMAQTEIPVGNEIGRKHDPDEEYERVFGAPAAARERLRYAEARRCTCRSEHPEKWGTRWGTQAAVSARRKEVLVSADPYDAVQDARSDRSEWTEGDVQDDAAEAFRWGFAADGREPEDSGREL